MVQPERILSWRYYNGAHHKTIVKSKPTDEKIYIYANGTRKLVNKFEVVPYKETYLGHYSNLENALQFLDGWIEINYPEAFKLKHRHAPWRTKPATNSPKVMKKVKTIQKLGVPISDNVSLGIASDLIGLYYDGIFDYLVVKKKKK